MDAPFVTDETAAQEAPVWFYAVGAQRHGPVTREEIRALAAAFAISAQTLVWRDGMTGWMPASATELQDMPELTPAPRPYIEGQTSVVERERWLQETPHGDPRTFTRLYIAWVAAFGVTLAAYLVIFGSLITVLMASLTSGKPPPDLSDEFAVRMLAAIAVTVTGLTACFVLWILLAHRTWCQVNDGAAATTPGMAVALSCIPCFNFYWSFIAVRGLAYEMNRVMDENGIPGPRPNTNLALMYCIANVCIVVPLVQYIAWPTLIVLGLIVYYELQRSGRRIHEWRAARAAGRRPGAPAAPVV